MPFEQGYHCIMNESLGYVKTQLFTVLRDLFTGFVLWVTKINTIGMVVELLVITQLCSCHEYFKLKRCSNA